MNRAVHEDLVAIEILPEAQWTCPSSLIIEDVEEKPDDEAGPEVNYSSTIVSIFFGKVEFIPFLLFIHGMSCLIFFLTRFHITLALLISSLLATKQQ